MTGHPTTHSSHDPLPLWEAEMRVLVATDLPDHMVHGLTAAAVGAATATAAGITAAGGGIMLTTNIAAEATASIAAKIAAGSVAATLAVGGSLAATGNLPDPAQEFAADAAAHVGITLPRPGVSAGVSGALEATADSVIDVAGAGRVGVTIEDGKLVVTGIEANGEFRAEVVSHTDDTLVVEFRSAAEKATALITNADGRVVSSVTTGAAASGGASAEAEANQGTGSSGKGSATTEGHAEADAGASGSTATEGGSAEAEAEAEAEVGIDIRVGG